MTENDMMEWDMNIDYNPQTFILTVDLDRYFKDFPEMKFVQIEMMGKKYKVDRLALSKMMEVLEAL